MELRVVPNPNRGQFHLTRSIEITRDQIRITSTDGKVIPLRSAADPRGLQINIDSVKGIYILQVQTEQGIRTIRFQVL